MPKEVPGFKICQKCPNLWDIPRILEDLFSWNGLTGPGKRIALSKLLDLKIPIPGF
jgi:hypothetical protein